ncbi:hypothetical protein WJX72_003590 [[Myrmecia] bisecta]|uniref:D-xylose 1-dehydrogenase (NADP(+), D-xylono-1,5-lactone-forming) n=1 Tax=[Myrmecia] bisecta TaxID=41462 RepID=A0AAW1PG82_9CHLO
MASTGTTDPLQKHELPSPFAHERPAEGQPSLKSCLWEVLKHHSQGLGVEDVIAHMKKEKQFNFSHSVNVTGEVEDALQSDPYFYQIEDSGKWSLAIFRPLKWGFAGTAQIAEDFIEALRLLPGPELTAVAARAKVEKAQEFAKAHGVKRAYGSYEELANDPEVDIVYISPIHTTHREITELMLAAGKHVLCEKPLAVNASDTKAMYAAAKKHDRFFIPGLWSRFFPAQQKLKELIMSGAVGEVLYLHGEMFIQMGEEITRLYKPEMGGGALLDIGIYMLALASWVYGSARPDHVDIAIHKHPSGVDVSGIINLKYGEKGLASLTYSMAVDGPIEGTIRGTKGTIVLHHRAHCPHSLTFAPTGGEPQTFHFDPPRKPESINHGDEEGGWNFGGSIGFVYEAMGVHSAVVNNARGVRDVPEEEMVALMELTDRLRAQMGVSYPQDGYMQKLTQAAVGAAQATSIA